MVSQPPDYDIGSEPLLLAIKVQLDELAALLERCRRIGTPRTNSPGRELEHAPWMIPSGWAVRLELYSTRYAFSVESSTSLVSKSVPSREEPFRL